MPISGARYRVKTTKTGKKVRLAWQGGKVVEAKNIKTGATHTPEEFAADEARAEACETGHCGENFGPKKRW
jgi:hypothetical protein